jgi:RNA polymerase sporulation-specific sigma factor
MLSAAVWLMLSSMLTSLRISGGGSFPKPLTAEEERIYLKRSAEGDLEARNILIERNLRLVAHIMKKYYSQSADQEDLISIGTIGLIKGISTFDASKGARLATYAARCVENAILSQRNNRRLRWRNGCLLRQNGACWREWESAAIS